MDRRFNNSMKVLAAVVIFTPAAALTAESCPPDPDLSALLWQLADMSARLAGTRDADPCPAVLADPAHPADDLTAACAAVEALQARRIEREGLCRQIDAAATRAEALRGEVALRDELLAGCSADRALAWQEWEAGIKRPRAAGRGSRIIACGPGGAVAYEEGGLLRGRIVGACIFPVWPR